MSGSKDIPVSCKTSYILDPKWVPHFLCTDSGTITILWSQPVAALQILGKDGKWYWVKHVENALVCHSVLYEGQICTRFSLGRECR